MSETGGATTEVVRGAGSGEGRASAADHWGAVSGVPQAREDRLPIARAGQMWNAIYELFGANSEGSRDEAFLAVNMYFWTNGGSPAGKYARDITTGGGVSAPAASVVKITGTLDGEIRQFLRAFMKKSYEAMRYSPAVRADAVMADKAETLGVPRSKSYLLADWLRGCEYMTPEEAGLQAAVAEKLIKKANERRGRRVGSSRADDQEDEVEARAHVVPSLATGAATWQY